MATNERERKPLHLAKLHVHKGDKVLVIAGKDRETAARPPPCSVRCRARTK